MRGGNEAGLRLGLGKQEQEDFYMAAENVTRKRLETEVQAEENTDRTQRREVNLQTVVLEDVTHSVSCMMT